MESAVEEVVQQDVGAIANSVIAEENTDEVQPDEAQAEGPLVENVAGPIFAKVDGRWKKFEDLAEVPVNKEDGPYHPKMLEGMTKNHLGEIYGQIAGVPAKNFKSKEVAIESVVYQANKLPDFGEVKSPAREAFDKDAAARAVPKAAGSSNKTPAKKPSGNFELLSPPDVAEKLKALAPQARELVLMAAEFAAEKGSTKFGAIEFSDYISVPERAARLHTRQEPVRILTYYRSKLDDAGLLKMLP